METNSYENEPSKEEISYQIALDIDVYMNDILALKEHFIDDRSIHDTLREANTILFDFFCSSLSDDFICKLSQKEFKDNCIEGVV